MKKYWRVLGLRFCGWHNKCGRFRSFWPRLLGPGWNF